MSESKKEVKTEQHEPKQEVKAPDLGEILATLTATVSQLAKDVAELKRPAPAFSGQPVGAPPRADGINPGFDKVKGYQKANRGFPVKPGQTWHDLTPEQRKQWFTNHENRWKQNYTARAQKMGGGEMNWTRG